LSELAVAILAEAKAFADGSNLIFLGTRYGVALSDMTLSKLVRNSASTRTYLASERRFERGCRRRPNSLASWQKLHWHTLSAMPWNKRMRGRIFLNGGVR